MFEMSLDHLKYRKSRSFHAYIANYMNKFASNEAIRRSQVYAVPVFTEFLFCFGFAIIYNILRLWHHLQARKFQKQNGVHQMQSTNLKQIIPISEKD